MKVFTDRMTVKTRQGTELINITDAVLAVVDRSKISTGLALVMTLHTTTAVTVNEGLPDVEADIASLLHKLAPDEDTYRHGRFLPSDGQMAVNATSHLRSALLGFECLFPVENGKLVMGGRHTIYLVELDGPQDRTVLVEVLGA